MALKKKLIEILTIVGYLIHGTLTYAVPIANRTTIASQPLYSADLSKNNSVCWADNVTYANEDVVPGGGPCEQCACNAPDIICSMIKCEIKTGCKIIQKRNRCCSDYECECEYNGYVYNNGEKIDTSDAPCRVCYCKGGDIMCTTVGCYEREDCEGKIVPGICCPKYDHCPPLGSANIKKSSKVPGANAVTIRSGKRGSQPWLLTTQTANADASNEQSTTNDVEDYTTVETPPDKAIAIVMKRVDDAAKDANEKTIAGTIAGAVTTSGIDIQTLRTAVDDANPKQFNASVVARIPDADDFASCGEYDDDGTRTTIPTDAGAIANATSSTRIRTPIENAAADVNETASETANVVNTAEGDAFTESLVVSYGEKVGCAGIENEVESTATMTTNCRNDTKCATQVSDELISAAATSCDDVARRTTTNSEERFDKSTVAEGDARTEEMRSITTPTLGLNSGVEKRTEIIDETSSDSSFVTANVNAETTASFTSVITAAENSAKRNETSPIVENNVTNTTEKMVDELNGVPTTNENRTANVTVASTVSFSYDDEPNGNVTKLETVDFDINGKRFGSTQNSELQNSDLGIAIVKKIADRETNASKTANKSAAIEKLITPDNSNAAINATETVNTYAPPENYASNATTASEVTETSSKIAGFEFPNTLPSVITSDTSDSRNDTQSTNDDDGVSATTNFVQQSEKSSATQNASPADTDSNATTDSFESTTVTIVEEVDVRENLTEIFNATIAVNPVKLVNVVNSVYLAAGFGIHDSLRETTTPPTAVEPVTDEFSQSPIDSSAFGQPTRTIAEHAATASGLNDSTTEPTSFITADYSQRDSSSKLKILWDSLIEGNVTPLTSIPNVTVVPLSWLKGAAPSFTNLVAKEPNATRRGGDLKNTTVGPRSDESDDVARTTTRSASTPNKEGDNTTTESSKESRHDPDKIQSKVYDPLMPYPEEYPEEYQTIQNGPAIIITRTTYTRIPDVTYTTVTMATLPTYQQIEKAEEGFAATLFDERSFPQDNTTTTTNITENVSTAGERDTKPSNPYININVRKIDDDEASNAFAKASKDAPKILRTLSWQEDNVDNQKTNPFERSPTEIKTTNTKNEYSVPSLDEKDATIVRNFVNKNLRLTTTLCVVAGACCTVVI